MCYILFVFHKKSLSVQIVKELNYKVIFDSNSYVFQDLLIRKKIDRGHEERLIT